MQNKQRKAKRFGSEIGKVDGIVPFTPYVRTQEYREIVIPVIGPIESPEDFIDHVGVIETAEEQDTIVVKINSPGGSLAAIDYLLQALAVTPANVHIEATGEMMSAASLIMDYADSFSISDNCEVLIHNAVFGHGGKCADVVASVLYSDKMTRKLLERYYTGMFSDEEMKELYEGKQFYMDNVEYLERFTKRQEMLAAMAEEEQPEENTNTSCQCENKCVECDC